MYFEKYLLQVFFDLREIFFCQILFGRERMKRGDYTEKFKFAECGEPHRLFYSSELIPGVYID